MSGGAMDYLCYKLDEYVDKVEDFELNSMLKDLVKVLHDCEWCLSGDIGEYTYQDTLNKFKKKWFGNRDERLRQIIENACNNLKADLIKMIGD